MICTRESYIDALKQSRFNGLVKVLTGIRRCGKSFLLFKLYHDFLISEGVKEDHIIMIALDRIENERLCDPHELYQAIMQRIIHTDQPYYVFIDEAQYAISKEELAVKDKPFGLYGVLNSLLRMQNVDVYVTGSNSRFLSTDVMTEFRGRGDVIPVYPLRFSEFFSCVGGDKADAYESYALYGGMPYVLNLDQNEKKQRYLSGLFEEIYFKDIVERYGIKYQAALGMITDALCSSIGSLTNASKISRTLTSALGKRIDAETVSSYLRYLSDSFLFCEVKRYDVKGKRYFQYPSKYFCTDVGLRNARLNFRQQEESHLMENIIFNELVARGYHVDVGVVNHSEKGADGKQVRKNLEVDFVVNLGMDRLYIQSALSVDDEKKKLQEKRSLLAIRDGFRKVIITKTRAKPWLDEDGILRLGLYDFLLDQNSLRSW
ncbi:MAG: ATP-binding protein [Sphaerochaeta sp.]|jgi:predicted AAA+ superfamily ATPase|nr:ATP-binding protein [Sphaerochaeta sp.]MCI2075822.1 ATP-binding protein [Sphaerochaeta sp.]MCI2096405.1 ATP-binding protein [Sphaerochaeta sp.]MCI2103427.1 ATP-binding protein [Sphaerochaeta sp.]